MSGYTDRAPDGRYLREPDACDTCNGDGVVTVGGYSLNHSSGMLVLDPQEAHDERCPDCQGTGLA